MINQWRVRLRLYRKLGLDNATAAEIVLFSSLTNWLGYCWVAGGVFAIGVLPAPAAWDIKRGIVQFVDAGLLALAATYLILCAVAIVSWSIIAHIPGGLGVTEAIFVTALANRMPDHQVLAALLMYRVLYQLIPLCAGALAYVAIELLTSNRTVWMNSENEKVRSNR